MKVTSQHPRHNRGGLLIISQLLQQKIDVTFHTESKKKNLGRIVDF